MRSGIFPSVLILALAGKLSAQEGIVVREDGGFVVSSEGSVRTDGDLTVRGRLEMRGDVAARRLRIDEPAQVILSASRPPTAQPIVADARADIQVENQSLPDWQPGASPEARSMARALNPPCGAGYSASDDLRRRPEAEAIRDFRMSPSPTCRTLSDRGPPL